MVENGSGFKSIIKFIQYNEPQNSDSGLRWKTGRPRVDQEGFHHDPNMTTIQRIFTPNAKSRRDCIWFILFGFAQLRPFFFS